MELSVRTRDGVTCITAEGTRLDAAGTLAFKQAARERIEGAGAERVVLDLSRVTFLDSSGLGALVAVMKLCPGRRLELAGCGPAVIRVLELTRMDRVFVLHADVEAAFAAGSDAA